MNYNTINEIRKDWYYGGKNNWPKLSKINRIFFNEAPKTFLNLIGGTFKNDPIAKDYKLLLTRFTTFLRTTTTSKYYLYLLQLMMIRSRIKNPPCSSIEEWDGQFTAWGLKEKQSAMCKRDTTLEFSPTFLSHHPTLRLYDIHHPWPWLHSAYPG